MDTSEADTSAVPSDILNSEHVWELKFHETDYTIYVKITDDVRSGSVLYIEVEQLDTNDRWQGEFTSRYVEEITLKAGSFKKFPTFVKMLLSAFTGDSDHVFIDLLTSTDLEMLKMKKKAAAQGSADTSMDASKTGNRAASMRRYCILTYASEFDRVHYPLPLSYETTPNVESLLSTIRRLRKEAQEKKTADVSDKERELHRTVIKLRQDNDELRHRLKIHASASPGGRMGNTQSSVAQVNKALAAANTQLRSHVQKLQKELDASTAAYERLRIDCAKEISRWKARASIISSNDSVASGRPPSQSSSPMRPSSASSARGAASKTVSSSSPSRQQDSGTKTHARARSNVSLTTSMSGPRESEYVKDLQRRLASLERELLYERRSSRQTSSSSQVTRDRSGASGAGAGHSASSSRASSAARPGSASRSVEPRRGSVTPSGAASRAGGVGSGGGGAGGATRTPSSGRYDPRNSARSASPTSVGSVGSRGSRRSAASGVSQGSYRSRSSSLRNESIFHSDMSYHERSRSGGALAATNGSGSGRKPSPTTSARSDNSSSSKRRAAASKGVVDTTFDDYAYASSYGRRFDPTAYQQWKDEKTRRQVVVPERGTGSRRSSSIPK